MRNTPPWTQAELREAYFRDKRAVERSLASLPGCRVYGLLQEQQLSFNLFDNAIEDLFDSIHHFRLLEDQRKLYRDAFQSKIDNTVLRVRRGIFSASSSAMALVEHSRRISGAVEIPGYEDRVCEQFSSWEVHLFIQGLRNFSVHRSIAVANWQVSYEFKTGVAEIQFLLHPESLLAHKDWKPDARKYIASQTNGIDVEATFKVYSERVREFQEWMLNSIRRENGNLLETYLYYRNIIRGLASYNSFNLLLNAVNSKVRENPEAYLDRYLDQEQLDIVLSTPAHSEERVDRIIGFLDNYRICDDDLRRKAMALFGVPGFDA